MIDSVTCFAFGLVPGVAVCVLWGMLGGDEAFEKQHPNLRNFLHTLHHWSVGLFIMCFSLAVVEPFKHLLLGFGTGIFLDDAFFHSFEAYFERKG